MDRTKNAGYFYNGYQLNENKYQDETLRIKIERILTNKIIVATSSQEPLMKFTTSSYGVSSEII